MPSAAAISGKLRTKAKNLERYLLRIEKAKHERAILDADVKTAYAGAWIILTAAAERSVEDIFLRLLCGKIEYNKRRVSPVIECRSLQAAKRIVRGSRPYVDWFPYETHTLPRAKSFFTSGKPFTQLGSTQIGAFEIATSIRNALAHDSDHAVRKFRRRCVIPHSIPASESSPAAYLRGSISKTQTRFAANAAGLVHAVDNLAQNTL